MFSLPADIQRMIMQRPSQMHAKRHCTVYVMCGTYTSPQMHVSIKVYIDKVAPSEFWASIILVTSLVNFYLVGLCTESDSTPE